MLLGLIWGGSFLAIRVALDEVSVLTSVAHRVGWAALILWGVAAVMRLPLPRDPRLWFAFLVMGLLNNIIPFGLMAWGQLHIETGLTSILNATTAFFGVLVAALVFADERLTLARLGGVLIGMAGVSTVIGFEALAAFDITSLAQLAVLGGTVSYAFAGAWARLRLTRLHPVIAAAGMLTASSVIALPAAWIVEGPISLDLRSETWLAIVYYAGAATAGAYLLYYRVLALAGAGNLMLVTLIIPPIAITLGAFVRQEALAPSDFAGFALIALGLIVLDGRLVQRFRRQVGF